MTTDADLEDLRTAYEQLRAENSRLRDELARKPHEYKSCFDLDEEVERLRATIARVEKLSLKWMDYVVLQTGEGIPDCADDLERALRGEL